MFFRLTVVAALPASSSYRTTDGDRMPAVEELVPALDARGGQVPEGRVPADGRCTEAESLVGTLEELVKS